MQKRAPSGSRLQNGINGSNPHRMNQMQIKEQEAINKERVRQEEYSKERQTNVKNQLSAQYQQVGSRVNTTGRVAPGTGLGGQQQAPPPSTHVSRPPTDDVEIKVFVNECDESAASMFTQMESAGRQVAGHQKDGSPYQVQKAPIQNSTTAGRAPLPRSNATGGNAGGDPVQRGQVPQYLQKRKAQAQADKDEVERIKMEEAEKSKYPPGHRPFTEEERTELLTKLAARKKELEYDLVRVPVRVDTLAVKKRRQQIETEMEEVDAATAKFSVKKQLYVPC